MVDGRCRLFLMLWLGGLGNQQEIAGIAFRKVDEGKGSSARSSPALDIKSVEILADLRFSVFNKSIQMPIMIANILEVWHVNFST